MFATRFRLKKLENAMRNSKSGIIILVASIFLIYVLCALKYNLMLHKSH